MSKHLPLPTSRLICVGDAKACTNALGGNSPETDDGPEFD